MHAYDIIDVYANILLKYVSARLWNNRLNA